MNDETTTLSQSGSVENGGRRDFLKGAGIAALGVAAAGLLTQNEAHAQRGALDPAVLNFALNLEYLEAEYYSYGTYGQGLESFGVGVTGTGTPGSVTVRANPQVSFSSNPTFGQIMTEITLDERAHVVFLRSALGSAAIARPAIDLQNSFNSAATAAARLAGIVGPSDTVTFDPYENLVNFIAGGFIFEDVGVTAYKGGSTLLSNKTYLEAAAGILAVEAYHAGTIRSLIATSGASVTVRVNGSTTPTNLAADAFSRAVSNLRDAADGPQDLDQGVNDADPVVGGATSINIVPTDANAIAFTRTTRQVTNIVYLDGSGNLDGPTVPGGFFPAGLNGAIR